MSFTCDDDPERQHAAACLREATYEALSQSPPFGAKALT